MEPERLRVLTVYDNIIFEAIAKATNITKSEIVDVNDSKRSWELSMLCYTYSHIAKSYFGFRRHEIGYFLNRHPSNINNYWKKHTSSYETDKDYRKLYKDIEILCIIHCPISYIEDTDVYLKILDKRSEDLTAEKLRIETELTAIEQIKQVVRIEKKEKVSRTNSDTAGKLIKKQSILDV